MLSQECLMPGPVYILVRFSQIYVTPELMCTNTSANAIGSGLLYFVSSVSETRTYSAVKFPWNNNIYTLQRERLFVILYICTYTSASHLMGRPAGKPEMMGNDG